MDKSFSRDQDADTSLVKSDGLGELERENARLKARLWEAEEILGAIRNGEVDAVVIGGAKPDAVYTFFGADHPYRIFVERMREGAVTLSRDGIILYANESFARTVNEPLSTVFGASFSRFVEPQHSALFQAFLEKEGEERVELLLKQVAGNAVPVYLSRSAVDLVGRNGIALVVTDLRDQKRGEEVVAAGNLAESILEQATEAIVVCDAEGRITHANRKAAKIAGKNPLLQPFGEVFELTNPGNEDGATELAERIRLVARGEQGVRAIELTLPALGGSRFHVLLSGGPLISSEGSPLGAVIVMADISSARKAADSLRESEARLRTLNATLEQRVDARTRELKEANKRLARKNRELQDFAYVASHDLQEPLRKVRTFAGLLRAEYGDKLDGDCGMYIDRMEESTKRMSSLISDLLALSRIATRGQPFERVHLREVVCAVVDDMELLLKETSASVEIGELPEIEADATQLRQLFQNLVSNAVTFHEAGADRRISVTCSRDSGADVEIRVSDNGIGFDVRFLDRIFTPFQRLHGRSVFPGTGMGLAICQRIVERHNGSITAESTPGEGSVFIICLPRTQK
jgi:PAS domain S-box-containing protein